MFSSSRARVAMAFTGLAFDPNHIAGDYDFSLLTVTEVVLRVIPLSRSTCAVMFFTEKTTGTVTSTCPDFRLEVSMPPVIERRVTDNVLLSLRCVPGGSRFHQACWFHYHLLSKRRSRVRSRLSRCSRLSCQPCLTRYHFPSFLDSRVFDCSSFPHRLTFTTRRLQLRFRTVVTMETGTRA